MFSPTFYSLQSRTSTKNITYFITIIIWSLLTNFTQSCSCSGSTGSANDCSSGAYFSYCSGSCSDGCLTVQFTQAQQGGCYSDEWGYWCDCNPNTYKRCQPCVSNCSTCTSTTVCSACINSYLLTDPNTCTSCESLYGPNCLNCDTSRCTTCSTGYVHDHSLTTYPCYQCSLISNCATCNDGPQCATCTSSYVRNLSHPKKECVSCSFDGCQTCVDGPVCSVCSSAYTMINGVCTACDLLYDTGCSACDQIRCTGKSSGYVFNTSTSQMRAIPCSIISSCTQCNDGPVCTRCASEYALDTSTTARTCFLCSLVPNCQTCSDGPVCTGCVSGSVINDLSVTLMTTCFKCDTISSCITCQSNSTFGPYCTVCITDYIRDYSLAFYACVACTIENCQTCVDGPECSVCKPGFCLDMRKKPYKCIHVSSFPNCQQCVNGPQCSICEPNYYLHLGAINKTCVPCSWILNCQSCADGPVCLSCITGYALEFITLNKTCTLCTSLYKCLQCTDGPVCTVCQPGFFINSTSSQCLPCHFPCTQCSLLPTNCTNCPPSQLYYLTAFTCKLCYVALPNCVKCDMTGTQCFLCNSTKAYIDTTTKTCTTCTPPCLDCLSATQCLSCATFSHLINLSTFTCEPCSTFMPRCATCIKSNVCTACDTTGTYYLAYPPDACVTCQQMRPACVTCVQSITIGPECTLCLDKYYLDTGNCYDCPVSCALCTSLIACTSCINNYYSLQNQLCVPCSLLIPNCQLCSTATTCTKCINGTIVDPAGSGKCVQCTSVQYNDEVNQLCQPCVSPCESCLNADDCVTCLPFREYVPAIQRCKDLCGDSIVITDQCDNGLGIFHDGCTDQCQQEPNYTCANNSDTVSGQSVFRSVCSYDLPLNITLFSVQKEPFKNTLTFTYLIAPYLFGLPGTTLRPFTQEELVKVFILYENSTGRLLAPSPTPGITVESVTVDSSNSKVSVTFSHDRDIKQSHMELYVDFGYLKSTLALPNFATTPDSGHLFQVNSYQPQSMIGQFYTQDQYDQAEMLHHISTAIGIMAFLAFLIGIFTKEVVGLEMAMLCQFTYLSLFFFQGTLELPFFALKGLVYSTGYNLPLANMNFTTLDQNPPQSFPLGFDPRTFSNNFNLMTALYIVPLVAVIPFIFLKAKCIRKISMIELGHKWVDLLLGEIMLFCVLFNLQYLLFGMIAFYQDGRDVDNYWSSMIIWLGMALTVLSFLGLIFKPEIYGNFRMVFRYNDDLLPEVIAQRDKLKECEEHVMKQFKDSSLGIIKKLWLKISLIVNENFLWRKHRRVHSTMTFNHYIILFVFFTLTTTLNSSIKNSEIITFCLSLITFVELIVARPYFEVSQKLRAIYFALIYTMVSLVRYFNNNFIFSEYNALISLIILILLAIALLWTFHTLMRYFCSFVAAFKQERVQIVEKVFQNTDLLETRKLDEEEKVVFKKLMKRYQRVELQYNVANAKTHLLQKWGELNGLKDPEIKNLSHLVDLKIYRSNEVKVEENELLPQCPQKPDNDEEIVEVLKTAKQQKNFKNLNKDLLRIHNKKKKQEIKKKATGQNMLKLLKLDNVRKYEDYFLSDLEPSLKQPRIKAKNGKISYKSQIQVNSLIQKKDKILQEINEDDSETSLGQKDEYESVDPKTLEEAQAKIAQEKIMIEENQFVRYERAREIIAKDGLTINRKLIQTSYDAI